jgi:hypothetical protein
MRLEHWKELAEQPGFAEVCEAADNIIRTQQLEMAAMGLFRETVIMRLLGLVDKTENVNHNVEQTHEQWLQALAEDEKE